MNHHLTQIHIQTRTLQDSLIYEGILPKSAILREIGRGMFSIAYEFTENQQQHIIRVSHAAFDFHKELYLNHILNQHIISTPMIQKIGTLGDVYYAIHKKIEGKNIGEYTKHEKTNMLKRIVSAFVDLKKEQSQMLHHYGLFDEQGQGRVKSWSEEMLVQENHKIAYDFDLIAKNLGTFARSMREITKRRDGLLPYLPNPQNIVHGDLGEDHIFITDTLDIGIIDWAEAKIGDYLYDIAYYDFWSRSHDMKRMVEELTDERNLNERYTCYQITVCLNDVFMGAHFNDQERIECGLQRAFTLSEWKR